MIGSGSRKDSNMLSDRYSPQEVEARIYEWWRAQGCFSSQDASRKPPFAMILPPPNVTGHLHLGHALNQTLQDTLARWKRMSGFNVSWIPGTDHAGISTQSVVEKQLAKEKVDRKTLGREKFLEKVWEWKKTYEARINSQMQILGGSLDWPRYTFTLDESVCNGVNKVFVHLYRKGWIYRGTKLINWSPKLESAISDLEVDHKEIKGSLWHIKYPVEGQPGQFLVVATTRPETLLGDVAVAVHPEDERYQKLIGKLVTLPLTQRTIPIIADEYVDREFGSGVVKITPAHDFNDYQVGQRHKLPLLNILNKDGTLNAATGIYSGLHTQKARERVVADLEGLDLVANIEAHTHSVGHCSRTGCVVEPYLSDQWFVRMSELSQPAKHVVESGTLTFEPESWTKTYLHWMNIIQDWCISRQLWWGHRIPAWTCLSCSHITVAETQPKECEKCKFAELKQDEDVLDTWFSSALWPFATLGWPRKTEALQTFYPTSILITGHDIIFFWVARMIMMGLEFQKDVPFRKVYLHGLIRDAEGVKMSKSLGNSVDPAEIVSEYGADALRFTLISQVASGRDLKFSTQRLDGYRNFMNKIWNASRFALTSLEDQDPKDIAEIPAANLLSDADRWIVYKLQMCAKNIDDSLSHQRFSDAAQALYQFVWNEFCDWYLEFIKPTIYGEKGTQRTATQTVLAHVLNRWIRLAHPFVPFITEEIFQKIPIRSSVCMLESYPHPKTDKEFWSLGSEALASELDLVREVITAIRNIRGENRIKPGEKISCVLIPRDDQVQKILGLNKSMIMNMARLQDCNIGTASSLAKCATASVHLGSFQVDVVIPLEGLVNFADEIVRLEKAVEKTSRELESTQKRLSNPEFLKNAPSDVVTQGQEQLDVLRKQLFTYNQALQRLKS